MHGRRVHTEAGTSGTIGYPGDIRSLTSLRYLAAAWVVLFHYQPFFGRALSTNPLLANGFLGVDFFFVLSGFVLAHVYLPQLRDRRFDYWQFLGRRIARVYPLHLLTLAAMLAFAVAAHHYRWHFTVWDPEAVLDLPRGEALRTIVAQVLLIHAWGATGGLYLNDPSWSISAEWFAYLLFPLAAAGAGFARGPARLPLAAAVVGLIGMAVLAFATLGMPLVKVSWNLGILRIAPEFFLGVTLYAAGSRFTVGRTGASIGIAVSLAAVLLILLTGLPNVLVVIALVGVILCAADLERYVPKSPLTHPFSVLLGEVSYAVYMLHYGVGILLFDLILPPALRAPGLEVPMTLAMLVVVTLLAYASHRWFELPTRRWVINGVRWVGGGGVAPPSSPKDQPGV